MSEKQKAVVLITGASSGIGFATARQLLSEGYRVYAAARRLERMAELEKDGARLLALDVSSDESMQAAVARIREEAGRVDALINNAGYGSYGAVEDVPIAEARRQFEVNVFGAARLIQLVLPMMRAQRCGRIVNISSMGGKIYEPLGAWYHATKFALEGFSDSLRLELAPHGIQVIVIQPGGIKSEWGGISAKGLLDVSGNTAYSLQALAHAGLLAGPDGEGAGSPPEVIAHLISRALRDNPPRTRYSDGLAAKPLLFLRKWLSDRAFDRVLTMMFRQYGTGVSKVVAEFLRKYEPEGPSFQTKQLPDDLWDLGVDRAFLYGETGRLECEHVTTHADSIYVLEQCLERQLDVVILDIVGWRNGKRGWKYAEHAQIWAARSLRGPDRKPLNYEELPLREASKLTLTGARDALLKLRGIDCNDDMTRYELSIYAEDDSSWPPNYPDMSYPQTWLADLQAEQRRNRKPPE